MESNALAPTRAFLKAVEELGVNPDPGGIDRLLDLLEEVEDSPGAAAFSPGLLEGIRVDLLSAQKSGSDASYLRFLGKTLNHAC